MGRLSASDRVSDHRPKELELALCTSIPPPMQSLTIPPKLLHSARGVARRKGKGGIIPRRRTLWEARAAGSGPRSPLTQSWDPQAVVDDFPAHLLCSLFLPSLRLPHREIQGALFCVLGWPRALSPMDRRMQSPLLSSPESPTTGSGSMRS